MAMDPLLINAREEKHHQIISRYAMEFEDLECPLLWQGCNHFDQGEFEKYVFNHSTTSDFDDMTISEDIDPHTQLINYSTARIALSTRQYFAYGVECALATVASLTQTITQESEFPNQGIDALSYVAKSCEVVLHFLGDKQVEGLKLKESMTVINDPKERGHLTGIHGLIYMLFLNNEAAEPFLRDAIPATNRFYVYVHGLARTIARIRRFQSSHLVTSEEIDLFREVAENHAFAVPQLLNSLNVCIRNMTISNSADIEKQFDTVLESAWNRKDPIEAFGLNGLTRLATLFMSKGQNYRAEELYKMVYDENPNSGMNLHQYARFLITIKTNIEDVKRGLGYLVKAGHTQAFISLLDFYFNKGSMFQQCDPFSHYLDQFISPAERTSSKRVYLYIAYKYFLIQGDLQKGISYLKKAMDIDLNNLQFEFSKAFKRSTLHYLQSLLEVHYVPEIVDLSYDVGYITDPNQKFNLDNTELPQEQLVTDFKAWWKTNGLKPMIEFVGYKKYFDKTNARSRATVDRYTPSTIHGRRDGGSSSSNWREDCVRPQLPKL